jgi:uncharacterized small protein (DUF1192 family)
MSFECENMVRRMSQIVHTQRCEIRALWASVAALQEEVALLRQEIDKLSTCGIQKCSDAPLLSITLGACTSPCAP